MRRIGLLVALVVAAATAAPAAAQLGGVVVAGQGTTGGGSTVTVGAFQFGVTGFVGGTLRVDSGPGFVFVSRVTCIRVLGDRVLVGGVIFSSPTPDTLGSTSLVAIRDAGPGGTDSIRIAFSRTGLDTCPVFPLDLFPISSGNFFVLRF